MLYAHCIPYTFNQNRKQNLIEIVVEQCETIDRVHEDLKVPFLPNILEFIKKREAELSVLQFNEYLYHVYLGVENATGIKLWWFDDGLCKSKFKAYLGGKYCLHWMVDLINSAGGSVSEDNINSHAKDFTVEQLKLLQKVYKL